MTQEIELTWPQLNRVKNESGHVAIEETPDGFTIRHPQPSDYQPDSRTWLRAAHGKTIAIGQISQGRRAQFLDDRNGRIRYRLYTPRPKVRR